MSSSRPIRAARSGGVTPIASPIRHAARIGRLLDTLGLATEPLPYQLDDVLRHLAADKKHAGGRLRWVLPTADAAEVRSDVGDDVVVDAAGAMLAAGTAR